MRLILVLLASLFVWSSAYAQSREDTVTYILLGIENGSKSDFTKSLWVKDGDGSFLTKYVGPNKAEATNLLTVTAISDCEYEMKDQRGDKPPVISRFNFEKAGDAQPSIPLDKIDGHNPARITIPNVAVCLVADSNGKCVPINPFESRLMVNPQATRTVAAMKYFKESFCKGASF